MLQEKWFLLLKENHSFKLFCITVLLCVRVLELEMWGGWGVGGVEGGGWGRILRGQGRDPHRHF